MRHLSNIDCPDCGDTLFVEITAPSRGSARRQVMQAVYACDTCKVSIKMNVLSSILGKKHVDRVREEFALECRLRRLNELRGSSETAVDSITCPACRVGLLDYHSDFVPGLSFGYAILVRCVCPACGRKCDFAMPGRAGQSEIRDAIIKQLSTRS